MPTRNFRPRCAWLLASIAWTGLLAACGKPGPSGGDDTSLPVMSFSFDAQADTDGRLPDGFLWNDRTPTAQAAIDPEGREGSALRLDNATSGAAVAVIHPIPPHWWREGAVVRVRGWLRTRDAKPAINGVTGVAALALRADDAARVAADDTAGPRPPPLAMVTSFDHGPTGTSGWQRNDVMMKVPAGTRRLVFAAALFAVGTAWVDDIEVTVERDLVPASDAALAYGREVLDIMQARAYHAPRIDWDAERADLPRTLAGTREAREVHEALRAVVRRVEPHSDLWTAEESAPRMAQSGSDERLPPLQLPKSQRILDRFGHVTVPAYVGMEPARMTRYADALQGALADHDAAGVCGYIVDLRENAGGGMGPMLAGLGPLLGSARFGGFVDRDGKPQGQWLYREGEMSVAEGAEKAVFTVASRPVVLRSPDAPVAVLAGGRTGSSGEATLVAFLGRPATRVFGEPSAGLTTGNEPIKLSDGSVLNLTTTAMVDRDGRVHDGAIVPDDEFAVDVHEQPASDPLVQRAAAWLATQPACRG